VKIKNIGYLFLLILSALAAIQFWKILFNVAREAIFTSSKEGGVLLLAWPIILAWIFLAIIFTLLSIFSFKQLQKTDKNRF